MSHTRYGRSVQVIDIDWTSDGSGDATETIQIDGQLVKMVTNPGATAPTADYDITIVDVDGVDVLAGDGADRHTSNSEQVVPTAVTYHYGEVTFTVANAGASKVGNAKLYVR